MKNFKVVPPKQRYMTLPEIRDTYGSRGVVAYSCKVADSVPEGGFVIAVLDEAGADSSGIKQYQRQLMQRYRAKGPIYYLCVEAYESGGYLTLTYDNGTGERKALPKIEVRKSAEEEAIERIPDELLARVLTTSLRKMP